MDRVFRKALEEKGRVERGEGDRGKERGRESERQWERVNECEEITKSERKSVSE